MKLELWFAANEGESTCSLFPDFLLPREAEPSVNCKLQQPHGDEDRPDRESSREEDEQAA